MIDNGQTLLIVSLTQTDPVEMRKAALEAFAKGATAIELRLDYLGDISDEAYEEFFKDMPGTCVITCRSVEEGGQHNGSSDERWHMLERAATHCPNDAWIDFELEFMKFSGPPPRAVENSRASGLILSAHDFDGRPEYLESIFDRMATAPGCDVAKVAWTAENVIDCFIAMDMIRQCPKPAIAIGMGQTGQASRILAKRFGAFGSFAALESNTGSAPGQAAVSDMINVYRWDKINGGTKLFGVAGWPVDHSLSPHIHNAAFDATGYNGLYVPLPVEPDEQSFRDFIDAILERPWMDFIGLSITIPHKANAMAVVGADNVDELSRKIGVINTIRFTGQQNCPLTGTNTDYPAVIDSLTELLSCQPSELAGRSAFVLGAGGVARAAVAALADSGVNTTIYNRTVEKAQALAADFDGFGGTKIDARPLAELDALDADIVINCTSAGMHPNVDDCPVDENIAFGSQTVVFDTIYTPAQTKLLKLAAAAGRPTINGLPMLINQAARQLKFWLDMDAPREVMIEAAKKRLEEGH